MKKLIFAAILIFFLSSSQSFSSSNATSFEFVGDLARIIYSNLDSPAKTIPSTRWDISTGPYISLYNSDSRFEKVFLKSIPNLSCTASITWNNYPLCACILYTEGRGNTLQDNQSIFELFQSSLKEYNQKNDPESISTVKVAKEIEGSNLKGQQVTSITIEDKHKYKLVLQKVENPFNGSDASYSVSFN